MLRQQTSIPLGHILGIPIDLDYSWFLIFVLLTWTFAVGYYPAEFHNWPTAIYWTLGAVTAIMLFVSVLLHELGHSVVALSYQIPVRRITLFIFGGVAQIGAEPPSSTRILDRHCRATGKLCLDGAILRAETCSIRACPWALFTIWHTSTEPWSCST